MNNQIIKTIIAKGKSHNTAFKIINEDSLEDVYKTVCSFTNRNGGFIFLGVNDNREIVGLPRDKAESYMLELFTALNDKEKFKPRLYLNPDLRDIDGKLIIIINVPAYSYPVSVNNRHYDRLNDSDIDITEDDRAVRLLHLRKYNESTLDIDEPKIEYEDLDSEFIKQITSEKTERRPKTKEDIMKELEILQLIKRDKTTNELIFKKSAVLLFGTDRAVFEYFNKATVDCLYFANNERYDDAIKLETNLLKAYKEIMNFILKHTDNKFFIEGDRRVDYREIFFREIVVNMLIHRNYSDGTRSRIEIDQKEIRFINPGYNDFYNNTDLTNISPNAKNRDLARIFRYYNLAEEFGSGLRKIFKYCEMYNGNVPTIKNKELYTVSYSLIDAENQIDVLDLIKENPEITREELASILGVSSRTISRRIKELGNIEYVKNGRKNKWIIKE